MSISRGKDANIILGFGYDIGVTLGPYVQGKLEAIATTGAACADDPEQQHYGVDFSPSYGVSLDAVLEDADGDQILTGSIAVSSQSALLTDVS